MPAVGERRDLIRDLILLVGAGLVLAALGPFGSISASALVRFLYWPGVIVGGGLIGIVIDEFSGRRLTNPWVRWIVVSVAMTPFVSVLVLLASWWAFGPPQTHDILGGLLWQVFVIAAPLMAVRQLISRRPARALEPEGEPADAAFRQRLSARRRQARLIAVEAEDHYLRIHTDAGSELIAMRFADAVAELAGVAGFQTHRSWWAAADAIEGVRWRKGGGELRLAGGLSVPVSRTYAAQLKAAGWF
ncbi:MAG: LytTR family DNA-binding domain-containing protein [Phenylobacterium sp.]